MFLMRCDRMVKLRGFRIDLREIEFTLLRHEQIENAAVVVRNTQFGDKLIALCDVMLRYKLPLVWSRVTNSFMVFVFDN